MTTMRKENIFLLTLRTVSTEEIAGNLEQVVVCSATTETLYGYAKKAFPNKQVLGAVSMAELEVTLRSLKEALECKAGAHPVFVDPQMKSSNRHTQH